MARYIAIVVVMLVVTFTAYFGIAWYRSYTNTSERVMASFANDLADADASHTYERLSDTYKQSYTKSAWQKYVRLFKKSSSAPVLVMQERVKDTFNTYPSLGDPQRFVYSFQIEGRNYLSTAIVYKQGNSWLVDEFSGDYK